MIETTLNQIVNVLVLITLFVILRKSAPKPKRKYKKKAKKVTKVAPKRKYKKKAEEVKPLKQSKGHTGWSKRRISKAQKAHWANMTPEQRAKRLDNLKRGRRTRERNKEIAQQFNRETTIKDI